GAGGVMYRGLQPGSNSRWAATGASLSPPRQPLAAHRRGARDRGWRVGLGCPALAEPAGELLALRHEVRRQLCVQVVEHRQRIGWWRCLVVMNGLVDLLGQRLLDD